MITRSADHRYTDTDTGTVYPGVTGILGILDKSGPLMSWAARQTAEAAIAMAAQDAAGGWSDHWIVEPDVGRVAHGVPARVDRLRALGNAVVPQVVEVIGRRLLG